MEWRQPFSTGWIRCVIAGWILSMSCAAWAATGADADFLCGGKVESQVWRLWDEAAKAHVTGDELRERLLAEGDTYALYDVQTFTHNLVAMARRCHRVERLEEMARVFGVAYQVLEPYPEDKSSVAWVCRGGATCRSRKDLYNHEVMLTSVQFLGLVSSIANGLAHAPRQREKAFVEMTAKAGITHLLRWGNADAISLLDQQIVTRARDIKNGSSALFFTDKELWMIAIYAELAGILQQDREMRARTGLSDSQLGAMREHLSRLLRFWQARTTLMTAVDRNGRSTQVADLDRGYWRHWEEFRYAHDTGTEKPVACEGPKLNREAPAVADDVGWDISHARRLVHALDAVQRNREAMRQVFGIEASLLPPQETVQAFARQLVVKVWNGDPRFPLFSNYWSGANGWYRVIYNPRSCSEGYPPSFLTDAFATGGYATWARHAHEIRPLARQLYELSEASSGAEREFMKRYYPKLSADASPGNRMLAQLMYWPSLVEPR